MSIQSSADPGASCAPAEEAGQSSSCCRPFGYGSVFPSFSPRSSGAGDTDFDWTMAEEKILRDVASWLSPADLRRARLVCKSWCGALATLITKAVTPPDATVAQWKGQLEALALAFPCLHELTVGSRLSSMAAQQLGVLAGAKQLHTLNIPHGQALQDRSLLAIQPLAPTLRVLRISGAASLSRRSLLLLSVLANLEVLELRNCGKISWFELQQAWRAACAAYEAHAAAEAAQGAAACSSSGGGSSNSASGSGGSSSGGGGFGSKLGAWLPAGRLFRTSSPSSNSIQSALAWQRSGPGNLLSKMHDFARNTSGAAAVAVAQLGIGAVGNGRSSCGGAMHDGAARSLLHRKQKLGAAASFTAYEDAAARMAGDTGDDGNSLPESRGNHSAAHITGGGGGGSSSSGSGSSSGGGSSSTTGCFPVRGSPLLRLRARSALLPRTADDDSPRPSTLMSRVGSLMWHSSSAASGGSLGSSFSFSSTSSTIAVQTSSVQAALLAYIAEEEQAATAAELDMPAVAADSSGKGTLPAVAAAISGSPATATGSSSSSSSGGHACASTCRAAACQNVSVANTLQVQAVGGQPAPAAAAGASNNSSSNNSSSSTNHSSTNHSSSNNNSNNNSSSSSSNAGNSSSTGGRQQLAGAAQELPRSQPQLHKPRRRTTGDKSLPAMPFTKLRSLSFSCSEVTLKGAGPELAAVAAMTSLTSLDISKCKLPDPVFAHLRSLSRLAKLRLSGLWSLGDAGLAELAQLSSLQSLALAEAMHVTAQGLQVLTSLSGLTSLAIGLTQDIGQGPLARVAAALLHLQCLEVAGPSWGDLDCELLAERAARAATGGGASLDPWPQPALPEGQMLWDVAAAASAGSFARSASSGNIGSSSSSSRAGSSKQLAPGALSASSNASSSSGGGRGGSLRAPSFSSCHSASFGSFSLPARAGAAKLQQQQQQQQGAQQPQAQQQLLVLRLHGSRGLTTRGLAALRHLPELHTLLLDNCRQVPAAGLISQGLLPPKLACLSLRSMPFGNLFSGCVSTPACGMALTRLELAGLEGGHEGQLRRLLSFFPRLADLSLAGCGAGVTDAALLHLPMLGGLTQLNLGATAVAGPGLEHLRALPGLRALLLKGCPQLCDAGLEALLAAAPSLEVLDVADCGGLGHEGLLAAAQGLRRLVRLDVSGCKGAGRALLEARPHYLQLQHSLPA